MFKTTFLTLFLQKLETSIMFSVSLNNGEIADDNYNFVDKTIKKSVKANNINN